MFPLSVTTQLAGNLSVGRLEGCMRVLRKQLSDDLKQGVTNDQVLMTSKKHVALVRFQTWELSEFGGTYKTDRYYIYIHIWII